MTVSVSVIAISFLCYFICTTNKSCLKLRDYDGDDDDDNPLFHLLRYPLNIYSFAASTLFLGTRFTPATARPIYSNTAKKFAPEVFEFALAFVLSRVKN